MLSAAAAVGVAIATASGGLGVPGAGPPGAGTGVVSQRFTSPTAVAPAGYRPPVTGPLVVLRPFAPPLTPYGPGHLGVDLALAPDGEVVAASAGRVAFAGQVAGRGVVVIAHPDGLRTEYEPVQPLVRVGAAVRGGALIGRLRGAHAGCPRSGCLHWGARRGAAYVDPLALLRPLGVVRLEPWAPP